MALLMARFTLITAQHFVSGILDFRMRFYRHAGLLAVIARSIVKRPYGHVLLLTLSNDTHGTPGR